MIELFSLTGGLEPWCDDDDKNEDGLPGTLPAVSAY